VSEDTIRRVESEPTEAHYRSATTNATLGLAAFSAVAPFAAPHVHHAIDKVIGPKDDGPQVVIPPGTVSPAKDE
jgi:hypothetical protein